MMKSLLLPSVAGAILLALWLHPTIGLACSTCFGTADDPMTKGLNMALFVMIGVTYVVILGMLAMFIALTVRARRRAATAQQGEHVAC